MVSLGLVLLTVVPALAAPTSLPPKVPKELLEKRRDAARTAFNQKMQLIRMTVEPLRVELCEWSKHWLEAEMALSEKKEDRLKALTDHLNRVAAIEHATADFARKGVGTQADAEAATYYRVDAEIRLLEAGGTPPAAEGQKEKVQKK
jgi:hypothetical protein